MAEGPARPAVQGTAGTDRGHRPGLQRALRRRDPARRDHAQPARHPLRRQAREEMDEACAPRGRPAIPAGLGPGGVPAAGRGRGDRALELSAVPLHRPADRGPRRRQPGDDQDERVDPGHRAPAQGPAGADLPRGPGRRGARRGRRRRGLFQAAVRPPAVHRRHQRRQARDARRRREPDPGHPGAGRQVAGDRLRQRADEGRRRADRLRQEPQRRADLRRARLRAGTEPARRGIRQSVQGGGPGLLPASFGQPRLHRDHQRAPARPPPGLSRRRPREGRDPRPAVRRRPATAPAADAAAERQRRHESDAGGNLRPAAAGDPLRAPGRRPGLCQPAPATAGPVLLRLRQGATAARAARDPLRRCVSERHPAACRPGRHPVRWRRSLRHGPLPWPRRLPHLQQGQGRVQQAALQRRANDLPALRQVDPEARLQAVRALNRGACGAPSFLRCR
ncbi:putative aldehyde dehydrogenase [Pseudomonas aeruginosa]|nr:putative aldehyde dehydrogenase [Pseudomonas aeruginosa]BAP48377.1 putative aldehyde dehydrogenase [Pseudomonas aeruginosa]